MSYSQTQSVFFEALEQDSPEELAQFLEAACSGDPLLRSRVEELLRAHQEAGAFLGGAGEDLVGKQIGPYKLLRQIGEGGFGIVYLAGQRHPIERDVALKMIKPGMDSREIMARFEAERQALAIMEHPNIARVLDAGQTDAEHLYFVMELVKGVPITEYADEQRLTTRERLELFIDVCRAVQHAHQKGVVHRDIKPSNVMVTLRDRAAIVKVIDFGVAKALNQELTQRTLFTAYGQMIGTPQYMSPEQAQMSGLDVDTRSDVYSLGVLLYELLTGSTPIRAETLKQAGYAEIQRAIVEEDTPRLTARLHAIGDELTVVAQRRGVDTKTLHQILRGELDWIVLKALEKERSRRYDSPGALAADVQRYLDNDRVEACPPSQVYRIKKFVARNRGLVTALGAVVASLLVGLGVATYAFLLAEQRRAESATESARAQKVTQALNEMLERADPSSGTASEYTVRAMLDDFVATLDGRFDGDPVVEATIRHTIGRAYFHLGLPGVSEPHLRRAFELINVGSWSEVRKARICTDLARSLLFTSTSSVDLREPENLAREAIRICRDEGESAPELADAFCVLGWILNHRDANLVATLDQNEAAACCREGLRVIDGDEDSQSLTIKGRLLVGLSFELLRDGRTANLHEAQRAADQGLRLLQLHRPHDRFMNLAFKARGRCQLRLHAFSDAESSFQSAMKLEKRATGFVEFDTLQNLMSAMLCQGKFDEALAVELANGLQTGLPMPPMHVRSQTVVGCVLLGIGDVIGAERRFDKAHQEGIAHFGPHHFVTIESQFWLSQALAMQLDSAKQRQATNHIQALVPIAHAVVENGQDERFTYGYALCVGTLTSPTPEDLRLALSVNQKILRAPLVPLARLRNLYAGAILQSRIGDTTAAIDFFQEICDSPDAYGWSEIMGDTPYGVLRNAEDQLARLLLRTGDEDGAEWVYRRAITQRQAAEFPDRYQIVLAKQRLASFLLKQGKGAEARDLLSDAQQALQDAPACFDWLRREVQQDLHAAQS